MFFYIHPKPFFVPDIFFLLTTVFVLKSFLKICYLLVRQLNAFHVFSATKKNFV